MQKNFSKVLTFALALVMVLGMLPVAAFASEVQAASSDLPTAIDGLSIAYPYNTENIQQTGSVSNRFSALTFESARNEVESAQMILTPSYQVNSFELTMNTMVNEKGNVIPSWAFEVYVQQYATVTGSGNSPRFGDFETQDSWILGRKYLEDVFHPRSGNKAWDGTYPDALIPQDAAIANGLNKISANKNQGIWVNLNVQDAAPGIYTGTANLTVNGTAMQIPVSIRVYDVAIPEEVHMNTAFGVWWDIMYAGEKIDANNGAIREDMITTYYAYINSKRITTWDRGVNQWRYADQLVEYAVSNATDPSISSYRLHFTNDASNAKRVDKASLVTCLTALINKNIELADAGSNVDLFAKAYYYFSNVDEPAGGSKAATYADVQACIDTLDSVKAELAPMLASYPDLQASFLALKNVVTGPDPVNYKNTWYIDGCPDYSKQSSLTSTYDSVVYCPQFNYMQTADMRATYADDSEVWWYGCCHPVAPYPTYHLNTPLANTRALGFMMYDYEIDGMLSSSVNLWGPYNDDGSVNLPSNYTTISDNGTPGDMILVYPGVDYGVKGPIGTLRIESIRESSEDYEYLWMLENVFGDSDISAYTAGLYDGVIVTGVYDGHTVDPDGDGNTDASDLYHTRRIALLTKLEQLNVAENGATEIAPGQEGFVRGTAFDAGVGTIVKFAEANYAAVQFDYKLTNDGDIAVTLRSPNDVPYYGVYYFVASGELHDYSGITTEMLSDGYVRVTMNTAMMDYTNSNINRDNVPATLNKLDILSWGSAGGYVDNVQLLTDAADIYTPETKADDLIHMTVFDNATYTTAAYYYVDNYVKAEGSTAALKVNTASNVHLCWDLRKEDGGMLDFSMGTLSAYFYFANGNPYAEAQLYDSSWVSGRTAFKFEDVGGGWYYGTLRTNADGYASINSAKTILLRLWFNKGTTVYIDGLGFEKLVDKNDMFAGGSWAGGNQWTTANNMTYVNNCTETYGEDSIFAWKFNATAANSNQWAQFLMGMTQAYNMDGYYLVFDAKVDGVASQNMNIRPRTGADGGGDPCNNTTVKLTQGWNTYTVDFAAALKSTSTAADLTTVQRLFMVFDFAATTGAERSVIIDNVRLVKKECKHLDTTTNTVDATCMENGSLTVICNACGETTYAETIPATGHNYQSVVTAPTPAAQGYTTHTCAGCGDSYVDSYTDYEVEGYLSLTEDMVVNLSLSEDFYVNLNGHSMTGVIQTNGYKIYGIDSTTDAYTCEQMGYFNCVDAEGKAVVPELTHKSDVSGAIKRYLTIQTQEGYTFHRFYIGITHMSLRPNVTGVGYKAIFGGDEMVQAQLNESAGFGYKLWLENGNPVTKSLSRSQFVPGSQGKTVTLLLSNFDVENYGEAAVYGNLFLKLSDGTIIESSEYS